MAFEKINKNAQGNPDGTYTRISGGTLWADLPIASQILFSGSTLPIGFLNCDGSTFSSTDYPDLYEALGSTTLPNNSGYIIKAKMVAMPSDFMSNVEEAIAVEGATAGDLASLDANGNLVDSGVVASNVIRRVNPSTAVDCNDLIDRFTEYRVGNGDANRPTTGAIAYVIKTFKTGDTSTIYSQIAFSLSDESIYRRSFNGTTWTSWQKLITESVLFPNYSSVLTPTSTNWTATQDCYVVISQLTIGTMPDKPTIDGNTVGTRDTTTVASTSVHIVAFSGFVKKGQVINYPQLTSTNITKIFAIG